MKNIFRVFFVSMSICPLQAQDRNHSFDVDLNTVVFGPTQATFVGRPTQASALNLVMTAQIMDDLALVVIATGNTHTFTSVGETFTFVVNYPAGTFSHGQEVVVSVTDIPGTANGTQGFLGGYTIVTIVPTLGVYGFIALVGLLALFGVWHLRKARNKEATS